MPRCSATQCTDMKHSVEYNFPLCLLTLVHKWLRSHLQHVPPLAAQKAEEDMSTD